MKSQTLNTSRLIWILLVVMGLTMAPIFTQADTRTDRQVALESDTQLSSRARTILFRCRLRQDKGQWAEAEAMMAGWLADRPDRDHHLLRLNLATSRLQLDQAAAALEDLRQAVTLEPYFGRAWLRCGETAYGLALYAEAGDAFAKGFDLVPDPQPQVLYYAAVSALLAEQPERALTRLETLLSDHRPEASLDWYQALLVAAMDAGVTDRARPYLNNLLSDFSDQPQAWILAYQFAAIGDDYRSAALYLTLAGYLRPLTRNEHRQLGDLYALIDVPLKAARHYEQALAESQADEQPAQYERLASVWMAAHQHDRARATLEKALAAEPSVRLWSLLGDLDYLERDYRQALARFARCCELDPNYGRGWLMQGYCAWELDQQTKARVYLQKAAGFEDHQTRARALLQRITDG